MRRSIVARPGEVGAGVGAEEADVKRMARAVR